jgi:hypothetical protein
MMNYRIVESSNRYDLATEVNDLIELGWRPRGGVSLVYSGFTETWAQAMVKKDK